MIVPKARIQRLEKIVLALAISEGWISPDEASEAKVRFDDIEAPYIRGLLGGMLADISREQNPQKY